MNHGELGQKDIFGTTGFWPKVIIAIEVIINEIPLCHIDKRWGKNEC